LGICELPRKRFQLTHVGVPRFDPAGGLMAQYECRTCDWSGESMDDAEDHARLHDVQIIEE